MTRHGGGVSAIWTTLGIEPTRDVSAIRRAYAARLKLTHPEDDPAGFAALRAAYEGAMEQAAPRRRQSDGVGPVRMSRKRQPIPHGLLTDWDPPVGDGFDRPIDEGDFGQDVPAPEVETAPAPRPAPEPAPAPLPPPPVPTQADRDWAEVDRRRRALTEALKTGNEANSRAALRELLRAPQMASIDVHNDNEVWLTRLILRDGPGLEHIAGPVSSFFGWETDIRREAHRDLHWRLRELRFLAEVSTDAGEWSGAWSQLQAAPVWKRRLALWTHPGIVGQVRKLLDQTAGFPAIRRRMDPEALDWWQHRAWRPSMPVWAWWLILLATAVGFVSASGEDITVRPLRGALSGLVVAAPFLIWLFAVAWPTELWDRYSYRLPRWLHYGWAPVAVLLIVLAATLPIHPWIGAALIGLSALNGLWALITGWPGGELTAINRSPTVQRLAIALGHLPLIGFWVFLQPFNGGLEIQLIAAVGSAILVHACGSGPLNNAWTYASPFRRTLVVVAALLCTAGAIVLVWTPPEFYIWQYGAALISIAMLLLKPAAERMPERLRSIRAWGSIMVALVIVSIFSTSGGADGLMPSGTALRGGVALLTTIVLFNALGWWDPLGQRRRKT